MSAEAHALLPDAADRLAAATDFDQNLVVVAGAGTGKTSLLVERLLVALGLERMGVEEFAAITFTEKAAGELRERLTSSLEKLRRLASGRLAPDEKEAATRAFRYLTGPRGLSPDLVARRAVRALEELDRAKISTIHAFCADILRAHPVEARVDPRFEVDPGPRLEALLEERWAAFLQRELGGASLNRKRWARILERVPLGVAEEVALGSRRRSGAGRTGGVAALSVPERLLRDGGAIEEVARELRALARRLALDLEEILARQRGMNPRHVGLVQSFVRGLRSFEAEGVPGLRGLLTREPGLAAWLEDSDRVPDVGSRLENATEDEVKTVRKEARDLLRSLARVDDALLAELAEALVPFVRDARDAYLAGGSVDFDGILVLARDVLRDYRSVREALKRRYRMLLVDEFQDTDPLQYEIVLFLGERPGGGSEDAYGADLEPGKLFVVGDPKQSIYRFRGADYAAFRRSVERVETCGGRALTLTTNFRSVEGILRPVNALFAGGASPAWVESAYQPRYVPIVAARGGGREAPSVEVWTVGGGGDAESRRRAEGEALASEIARGVAAGECGYRDVFVLLRAFSDLAAYLRPLRAAGIPFVVDGGREFLERTEIQGLRAALRTLARPSDPAALLAFLRSPAGAVPDAELARYAADGRSWSWREEPDAGKHPGIARSFRKLRELAAATRGLPADAAIRKVAVETHLLPLLALGFEGAQGVANLRKLAATAAGLAWDGSLTLDRILDVLDEERVADIEGDSPLADEQTDAVRILTIHKAKGLENRIVFVPDLGRGEPGGPRAAWVPAVRVVRLPSGALALSLETKGGSNSARALDRREERLHERAELLRLLYVAATRARERLVLLAGTPSRNYRAPWLEVLAAWDYRWKEPPEEGERLFGGAVMHRRVAGGAAPRRAEPSERPTHPAASVAAYGRALEVLRGAAAPPLKRPSGEEDEEPRDAEEIAGRPASRGSANQELARAVGAVVHHALERMDLANPRSLLEDLDSRARRAAAETGTDAARVGRAAREVLGTFVESPLSARLGTVEVLGREVPVLLLEGGQTWRGNLDLLYRDPDGAVVVADYKTDALEDGAELVRRYGPQLAVYVRTVQRALGLPAPPRAELWMLRSGRIVTVETGTATETPGR